MHQQSCCRHKQLMWIAALNPNWLLARFTSNLFLYLWILHTCRHVFPIKDHKCVPLGIAFERLPNLMSTDSLTSSFFRNPFICLSAADRSYYQLFLPSQNHLCGYRVIRILCLAVAVTIIITASVPSSAGFFNPLFGKPIKRKFEDIRLFHHIPNITLAFVQLFFYKESLLYP